MSVYFCFQGDRSQDVADVNVSIDRKALEGVEESLLSKLADDTSWNTSNREAGHTADDPIMTTPLQGPCKDDWDPSLAHMIADAYRYHQEKKKWDARIENTNKDEANVSEEPPRLKLPDGVELEDALVVLDYYGLKMDESVNFDFSECSDDVHIRAKLFLKWMKEVQNAKQFIVERLKTHPKVTSLFLFASSRHDMRHINRWNDKNKFIRVGRDGDECDDHFEWIENAKLRETLLASLEESGLEASFANTNFFEDMDEADEWIHRHPKAGHSFLSVGIMSAGLQDRCEQMCVLQVVVPRATKKQRTAH